MQINYALIGCGRISPNHIVAAVNCGFNIVALCDTDRLVAQQLMDKFSLKQTRIYDDYRQMIDSSDIDVVSIATPSGSHAEIAIECCKRHVNVIVEKPIALSISDAQKIYTAALHNGVKATVCHQNRYNKAVKKSMELVESGMIGELYCVSANVLWSRDFNYYAQSPWRGTWDQDGGVLMNQGIHNIDLLRWFAGSSVKSVSARISNALHPYIQAEDIGVAVLDFKNGCLGTINCTSNVFPKNLEETLYLLGSKGTIKLGGKSVNKIEVMDVDSEINTATIMEDYSNNPPNIYGYGHTPLFKDFKNSIIFDNEPYISVLDAAESLELVLGIYKSAIENNTVDFPIADFSTTDMKRWENGV